MNLGTFSVSLAVKDIAVSLEFYKNLGFEKVGGDQSQNWLVIRNGDTTIGLFQGMFERNILTFNPGWDLQSNPVSDFDDVRKLQSVFKAKGMTLVSEADESSKGPASLSLLDPDGNPILIDQHV